MNELRVTEQNLAIFRETRDLLKERIATLAKMVRKHPLIFEFAESRVVLHSKDDLDRLQTRLEDRIREFERNRAATSKLAAATQSA